MPEFISLEPEKKTNLKRSAISRVREPIIIFLISISPGASRGASLDVKLSGCAYGRWPSRKIWAQWVQREPSSGWSPFGDDCLWKHSPLQEFAWGDSTELPQSLSRHQQVWPAAESWFWNNGKEVKGKIWGWGHKVFFWNCVCCIVVCSTTLSYCLTKGKLFISNVLLSIGTNCFSKLFGFS